MATKVKAAGNLTNKIKNDETLGTLDLKTFVYITLTVTLFQLSENVSSYFGYIAIGAMLVGALVIETDQIAFAYIVLAASNRLLNVGDNIPVLPMLTIIYIARVYVLQKGYKKTRIDTQMTCVLVIYSLYCMRYFFLNYSISLLMKSLKLFFSFILLIDIFKTCKTKDEARVKFNQLVFYMSLGINLTAIISFAFLPFGDQVGRFSLSENSGANILGIYISSAIAAAILILLSENTLLFKRAILLMMIPTVYVGLLTQSRTYSILFVIAVLWALFLGMSNKQTRSNTGLIFAIAAIAIILFLIFGKNTALYELLYDISDRFINPRHDDVTGGRRELTKAYLKTIFRNTKYLFLGSDGSLPSPGGGVAAHNMIIEDLYGNGLVGLAIICWMFFTFFKKVSESFIKLGFSPSLAAALPLVLWFAGGMSSHSVLGAMPTNEFFIGVCALYYYTGPTRKNRRSGIQPIREYQRNRARQVRAQGEE